MEQWAAAKDRHLVQFLASALTLPQFFPCCCPFSSIVPRYVIRGLPRLLLLFLLCGFQSSVSFSMWSSGCFSMYRNHHRLLFLTSNSLYFLLVLSQSPALEMTFDHSIPRIAFKHQMSVACRSATSYVSHP